MHSLIIVYFLLVKFIPFLLNQFSNDTMTQIGVRIHHGLLALLKEILKSLALLIIIYVLHRAQKVAFSSVKFFLKLIKTSLIFNVRKGILIESLHIIINQGRCHSYFDIICNFHRHQRPRTHNCILLGYGWKLLFGGAV